MVRAGQAGVLVSLTELDQHALKYDMLGDETEVGSGEVRVVD